MEAIINDVKNVIRSRISNRVPIKEIRKIIPHFYIGGNSLNRTKPNDIDIFPTTNCEFVFSLDTKILSSTKNATTISIDGITVQFCNYRHKSLKDLVDSFDFSHIQVGAEINGDDCEIYFSDAYIKAKLTQSTEFVGSQYPLGSLIRAFKYQERGDFSGKSYIFSVLEILNNIIERGFSDYNDFKDQLDAVDLGLLPEDFKDMDASVLTRLYKNLSSNIPKEEL